MSEPIEAVVQVEAGGYCAGAVVSPEGTVLTAYHCVAGSLGRARVTGRDGVSHPGRVRGWDVGDDLAWIAVPELAGSPWLPVREALPAVGEPVRALGHPRGADLPAGYFGGLLRWSTSEGVVSGIGDRAMQFDAPVNPGNSGGPVVDAEGRVVSVVSRRLGGDGLGFGARTDRVSAVLAEDPRRLGVGGALSLGWRAWTLQTLYGGASVGPVATLDVRDRLLVEGWLAAPIAPAMTTLRFGGAAATLGTARLGLRQPLGRAASLDVLGGIAWSQRWSGRVARGAFALTSAGEAVPTVGGALAWHGTALELGVQSDGAVQLGLALRWPGTLGIW